MGERFTDDLEGSAMNQVFRGTEIVPAVTEDL